MKYRLKNDPNVTCHVDVKSDDEMDFPSVSFRSRTGGTFLFSAPLEFISAGWEPCGKRVKCQVQFRGVECMDDAVCLVATDDMGVPVFGRELASEIACCRGHADLMVFRASQLGSVCSVRRIDG